MKISAGTIARTICLMLALANQILAILGKGEIPFVEEDVYQVVSTIFMIVSALVAWWKNNSFTKAALVGDAVMMEEKGK